MTKLLIVLAVIVMVGGLAGGLSVYAFGRPDPLPVPVIGPDGADNGPPDVLSARKLGDIYEVSLDSNPTTGYQWQVEFDEDFLELVDRRFELDSDLVGAGGTETFVFRTVAKGTTRVEFTYKRSWESESLESKVYAVDIN